MHYVWTMKLQISIWNLHLCILSNKESYTDVRKLNLSFSSWNKFPRVIRVSVLYWSNKVIHFWSYNPFISRIISRILFFAVIRSSLEELALSLRSYKQTWPTSRILWYRNPTRQMGRITQHRCRKWNRLFPIVMFGR